MSDPAPEATPGQAAYEAWRETFRSDAPWSDIDAQERGAWDAAAQAAAQASLGKVLAGCARYKAEQDAAREGLRPVLREHYLMQVVCDPERKQDNPVCQCSRVNLGWHPSIGAAVEAWIDHVLAALAMDAPRHDDWPDRGACETAP